MKILQITVHFSPNLGGVETHLDDLLAALRKHKVYVLTYKPLISRIKTKFFEKKNNLTILRLPWFRGLFYQLTKSPVLEFIYLVPVLFVITPFVILSFRPEVIHSHGLLAGFVAVFWGKVFRIRTITTTHSEYSFPKKGIYKTVAKTVLGTSDKILALSKRAKEEIVSLGIDTNKVTVFTYWIDLVKFRKIEGAKRILEWEGFNVLFVGRLVEEKGILQLLDSLGDWDSGVNLRIAGNGPLKTMVVNHLSRTKQLEYLGRISQEKLPLYYSAADVVIVPSTHPEGFGRIILESLACGTPVIGSNTGGIPEALNKRVGELIKISPKCISNTVNSLHNNKSRLKSMETRARMFAEKRYSEKNARKIIRTYKAKT